MLTYNILSALDQRMIRDAVVDHDPAALAWLANLSINQAVAAGYLILALLGVTR